MKSMTIKILAPILTMGLMISSAQANKYLDETIATYAKAITGGDYKTVARLSHPSIVKAYGGVDAYAGLIDKTYAEAGMRFTRMKFGKVVDQRSYGKITLATIPYSATVAYGKEHEDVSSFYYAFSGPKQKGWFLVDCSNATDKLMGQLVAGYDNKLKTPGAC